MKYRQMLFILIGALFINLTYAATTSTSTAKPPQLQVRSTSIQAQKNSTTKYDGNVEVTKGTLVIKANTALLQNKQGTLMISGTPATFIDMISAKEQITASAQTMNLDDKANKIVLKGNASITKDGKKEQGKQLITYDLKTHSYKF